MDRYTITFQTWNKIASVYQEKFMHLDIYNAGYDQFCSYVNKQDAKILEIGTGPGNITRYLLSKQPSYRVKGIDVAPNMIDLARQNNPGVDFAVLDCREIDTLTDTFDAIICGFCLPYLSKNDVATLLNNCSALLQKDGILYLSTIEGNYADSGFEAGSTGDKAYVYYYEEGIINEMLLKNNFRLLDTARINYSKTASVVSTQLIFIAAHN